MIHNIKSLVDDTTHCFLPYIPFQLMCAFIWKTSFFKQYCLSVLSTKVTPVQHLLLS